VVAIVGARKACCRRPEAAMGLSTDKSEKCEDEFKVLDSLEGDQLKNNWFRQDSVLGAFNYFPYIVPCRSPDDRSADPKLELCLPDVQGKDSLYYSVAAGDVRRIRDLAANEKWDPDSLIRGERPISIAILWGETEMFIELLDLRAKTSKGTWSAFNDAVRTREASEIAEVMIRRGLIDLTKEGAAAWESAVGGASTKYSNLENLRLLREHGAPFPKGASLLRKSVDGSGANIDTTRYLLQARLDPNEPDESDDKQTALHYAVLRAKSLKRTDVVKLLCEFKANPDLQNAKGKTAIDMARDSGYPELLEVLKNRCPSSTTH
jgi:hypothetical protein